MALSCEESAMFLFLGKFVLTYSAKRTLETLRNVLPKSSGFNSVIRIADFLVINVATYITNVFHLLFSFFEIYYLIEYFTYVWILYTKKIDM